MSRYIDITPSWSSIAPALIDVLLHTKDYNTREDLESEIKRMAKLADCWVEHCKQVQEAEK
jgi:hypothetical protein